MTTPHLRKSIGRSPLRRGLLLIPLVLACFGLSPTTRAQLSPPPDGGYPGGNTAEGDGALSSYLGNYYNTAVGNGALGNDQFGIYNTAIGYQALANNTADVNDSVGVNNTATGSLALYNNTIGYYNTATGESALYSNTTGGANTASGVRALSNNTTGRQNTANGVYALLSNTTGNFNTVNGFQTLQSNTTGAYNTANGWNALRNNTTGAQNTANGISALVSNTIGNYNTAEGFQALYHNTGSNNIGLGSAAGLNLTTDNGNVCLGAGVIGVGGESNTTRIRNVYASVASARAVYVNSDNKIGTLASSRRFKDEIKPMDKASETILALKPVTFRYKKEFDRDRTPMFGLVAEEVEKVNPDLVTRNDKGEIETVRYEAVNAMLLNEFLKEHRKVELQEATITQVKSTAAKQEATIAKQQKQIEALTTGLQKVSAQLAAASPSRGGLEMSKPAPQIVLNDQ
jgi:uncharacterized coiled-coil protein SlyX